jgi:hypothetical protein
MSRAVRVSILAFCQATCTHCQLNSGIKGMLPQQLGCHRRYEVLTSVRILFMVLCVVTACVLVGKLDTNVSEKYAFSFSPVDW